MSLKDKIIQDFLSDNIRNFAAYQTNYNELSDMWDKLMDAVKQKMPMDKFLNFERAITSDGKIRFDRESSFYDQEKKKAVTTKVVFRYPVYRYLESKYKQAMGEIVDRERQAITNIKYEPGTI